MRDETFCGAHILPAGCRGDSLLQKVGVIFSMDMASRVPSYDGDAHAAIVAMFRVRGQPISPPDAMIVGIARSHGATLATRNVRYFEACSISLVDPWH